MKLFCSLVVLFLVTTTVAAQTKEVPTAVSSSQQSMKEPTLLEKIDKVKKEIAEIKTSLEKVGVNVITPETVNPNDLDSLKAYLEELKAIRQKYPQTTN